MSSEICLGSSAASETLDIINFRNSLHISSAYLHLCKYVVIKTKISNIKYCVLACSVGAQCLSGKFPSVTEFLEEYNHDYLSLTQQQSLNKTLPLSETSKIATATVHGFRFTCH